jgi:hypothetical protein
MLVEAPCARGIRPCWERLVDDHRIWWHRFVAGFLPSKKRCGWGLILNGFKGIVYGRDECRVTLVRYF